MRSSEATGSADEYFDAVFQRAERVAEGLPLFDIGAINGRRIRHSPMRGDRLPRPDRADLARRLIADGKNEIHHGRVGFGEFVPALAAQSFGRQFERVQQLEGARMNSALRKAARAVAPEAAFPQWLSRDSAKMLRAELPVQRNRTLKGGRVMTPFLTRSRMQSAASSGFGSQHTPCGVSGVQQAASVIASIAHA